MVVPRRVGNAELRLGLALQGMSVRCLQCWKSAGNRGE